jgi:hypothetical protein
MSQVHTRQLQSSLESEVEQFGVDNRKIVSPRSPVSLVDGRDFILNQREVLHGNWGTLEGLAGITNLVARLLISEDGTLRGFAGDRNGISLANVKRSEKHPLHGSPFV